MRDMLDREVKVGDYVAVGMRHGSCQAALKIYRVTKVGEDGFTGPGVEHSTEQVDLPRDKWKTAEYVTGTRTIKTRAKNVVTKMRRASTVTTSSRCLILDIVPDEIKGMLA